MKNLAAFFLLVLSPTAFAVFNEVECEGKNSNHNIYLEVEQPFPSSSVFKNMLITVTANGAQQDYHYAVTSRGNNGFNRLQYWGGGARLEVDLWPDRSPRWGRTYRSILTSTDVANNSLVNLDCQFPNAN